MARALRRCFQAERGARRHLGLTAQAPLPAPIYPSAWPEPEHRSSPGDPEPQEAFSHSSGEASGLILNIWTQLWPLGAEGRHEPGLHHQTKSSPGQIPL